MNILEQKIRTPLPLADLAALLNQRRSASNVNSTVKKAEGLKRVKTAVVKLISKTKPGEGGCLNWTGASEGQKPYGVIQIQHRKTKVHRLVYVLCIGFIGQDQECCHTCDNTICCNPEHLFAGCHDDNMKDMVSKKRGKSGFGGAKLTPEQVLEIRRLLNEGQRIASLSRVFNTHRFTIMRIRDRKSWKHIP